MTDIEAAVRNLAASIDALTTVVNDLAEVHRQTFNATLCPRNDSERRCD